MFPYTERESKSMLSDVLNKWLSYYPFMDELPSYLLEGTIKTFEAKEVCCKTRGYVTEKCPVM